MVEDLFRLSDLTHVVIVASGSDCTALAPRCKQLGRYVMGIGVAGATSKALAYACNKFAAYDALSRVRVIAKQVLTPTATHRSTAPEVVERGIGCRSGMWQRHF